MQGIEFVTSHQVDQPKHHFFRLEISRDINVQTSIRKAWFILDDDAGHRNTLGRHAH